MVRSLALSLAASRSYADCQKDAPCAQLSAQPATVSCAELLRSCVERNGRCRSGFLGQDHRAHQAPLCGSVLRSANAHRAPSVRTQSSSAMLRRPVHVCFCLRRCGTFTVPHGSPGVEGDSQFGGFTQRFAGILTSHVVITICCIFICKKK